MSLRRLSGELYRSLVGDCSANETASLPMISECIIDKSATHVVPFLLNLVCEQAVIGSANKAVGKQSESVRPRTRPLIDLLRSLTDLSRICSCRNAREPADKLF